MPDAEERKRKNMTRSDSEIATLINLRKAHDEPVGELEEEQSRRATEKQTIEWPDSW